MNRQEMQARTKQFALRIMHMIDTLPFVVANACKKSYLPECRGAAVVGGPQCVLLPAPYFVDIPVQSGPGSFRYQQGGIQLGEESMSAKGLPVESGIGGAGSFPPTHWSVVLSAGQEGSTQATAALEELCRSYWYPLYAYIRRKGHDAEEAQDLTQEFLIRLLEKNYLAHVDRRKGKFRSFLLSALNHFLANEWRRGNTAKRGGGNTHIPLDNNTPEQRYAVEPVSDLSPERIYERRWALALLDQALAQLREECAASGRAQQFDQLKSFLTTEAEEKDYESAATRLQMRVGAVAVTVHRLRQRYRELLRKEIAHTVTCPAEVEEEIRWLFAALG